MKKNRIIMFFMIIASTVLTFAETEAVKVVEAVNTETTKITEPVEVAETLESMEVVEEVKKDNLGKQKLRKVRREIGETIEEKIAKPKKSIEEEKTAAKDGFATAKDRIKFLKDEETELMRLAKEIKNEKTMASQLYGEKFDEVEKKFFTKQEKILKIKKEKEDLEQYLIRLNKIEGNLNKTTIF